MFRRNVLDLDVLDSPIISPTPLSVGGLGIPGSALAERIFNDPEAWTTGDDADSEEGYEIFRQDVIQFGGQERSQEDPLAWLAEEIEKFQAHSAGTQEVFVDNAEEDDDQTPELKQFEDKYRLTPREMTYNWGTKWEGVKEDEMARPIPLAGLFAKKGELTNDVHNHLARILEGRDLGALFRSFPSPPHSSGSNTSEASSSSASPARLDIDVNAKADADAPVTPIISPVAVHSASTTLSFLEWYGIYPDSPRLERVIRKSIQAAKKGQKPVLQLPPMPDSPSPKNRATPPLDPPTIGKLVIPRNDSTTVTDAVKPPSRRASPIPPPGLTQSPEETAPVVLPSLPKPPTSILPPVPPPSYRRSPSPCSNARSDTPERRRAPPSDTSTSFRTPTKSATVSVETPVRRLPLVPGNTPSSHAPVLRTATPPSSQKVVLQTPPPHTASPPSTTIATPTSCNDPSTPGYVPRKCSAPTVGTRPLSAARSPPAGPVGPRSRSVIRSSSFGSFCVEPRTVRSSSGQRRPPALKFDSTPELKI